METLLKKDVHTVSLLPFACHMDDVGIEFITALNRPIKWRITLLFRYCNVLVNLTWWRVDSTSSTLALLAWPLLIYYTQYIIMAFANGFFNLLLVSGYLNFLVAARPPTHSIDGRFNLDGTQDETTTTESKSRYSKATNMLAVPGQTRCYQPSLSRFLHFKLLINW